MTAAEGTAAVIVVLGTLRFPPDRIPDVLPHLRRLVDETNRFDGCLLYQVAEDPFDPGLIRFSELWPDREALTRHLKAPHIAPWRQAAKACGLMSRQFTAYQASSSWSV